MGKDFVIIASYGHIYKLNDGWSPVDINDINPEYILLDDKKEEEMAKLKKIVKKIKKENIFLGTDEDYEGEFIAWSLKQELGLKNPKRVAFTDINEKTVLNALENYSEIDYNKVNAQQTRRLIDRIAGFIISPLLSNTIPECPSAGRVQSVVVRLLVEKEEDIKKHIEQDHSTFFTIGVEIKYKNLDFNTKLYLKNDKTIHKFDKNDEDCVKNIMTYISKSKMNILNLSVSEKNKSPPEPFSTLTMQQQSATQLKITPAETMKLAQTLYESGYITYMRTDSICLSEEATKDIKKEVKKTFGNDYYKKTVYQNRGKNTQEAHECIRPTSMDCTEIEGSDNEKKLYQMIWARTMQSQMKEAIYQNVDIEINCVYKKKLNEFKLCGSIDNLIFNGYMIIDGKNHNEPIIISDEEEDIVWEKILANEDIKQPPERFNDVSLLEKIKALGIGRPSSYANIIPTILKRNYATISNVEGNEISATNYSMYKEDEKIIEKGKKIKIGACKKKLIPTENGKKAVEFLTKHFGKIMDYQFTAKLEEDMHDIANNTLQKNDIIQDFLRYVLEIKETFNIVKKERVANIIGQIDDVDVQLIISKKGKYCKVGDLWVNIEPLYGGKKNPSEKDIVKYTKKNLPIVLFENNGNKILQLTSSSGSVYAKEENTNYTVNLDEFFKNNAKPKKNEIKNYIMANIPISLGKIKGKDVILKTGKNGFKYVKMGDEFIDGINDIFTNDEIEDKYDCAYGLVKHHLKKK